MQKIRVLGPRVLIQKIPHEEKTESGLWMVRTGRKEPHCRGRVVAVGSGQELPNGKRVPIGAEVGSTLLFLEHYPEQVWESEGKEYLFLDEDKVLGVEG